MVLIPRLSSQTNVSGNEVCIMVKMAGEIFQSNDCGNGCTANLKTEKEMDTRIWKLYNQ
jgi:hypothetical protein